MYSPLGQVSHFNTWKKNKELIGCRVQGGLKCLNSSPVIPDEEKCSTVQQNFSTSVPNCQSIPTCQHHMLKILTFISQSLI